MEYLPGYPSRLAIGRQGRSTPSTLSPPANRSGLSGFGPSVLVSSSYLLEFIAFRKFIEVKEFIDFRKFIRFIEVTEFIKLRFIESIEFIIFRTFIEVVEFTEFT